MIAKNLLTKKLPLCGLVTLLALSFLRFDILREAIQNALSLCAVSIVPSLFPFLIFTDFFYHLPEANNLLKALSKPFAYCFRVTEEGAVSYLYGLLFGFPLGIKVLAQYYKDGFISKKEAGRLLLFCNNTGPAFLIGAIGIGFLKNASFGILLYLTEIMVSFFFGIMTSIGARRPKAHSASSYYRRSGFSFASAVQNSVSSMLSICGYIVFFSAFCALLSPLFRGDISKAFFFSFLEIGTASSFLTQNILPPLLYSLLGFAVCFGGISVYMQCLDFIVNTDIPHKYYIPSKLLQGFFAFALIMPMNPFLC